jgi:hypothetical protein
MATLTFYQPAKMLDPQGFFGEIEWEVSSGLTTLTAFRGR